MAAINKVLWAEGVLLGQQHLQQWDRYHEAQQHKWAAALNPLIVGVKHLIIDEEALLSGQLIIKQCELIFPHGLMLSFDEQYDGPLALQLNSKPQQQNTIDIYLGIALATTASGISGYAESQTAVRWRAHYQVIPDAYDALREREVLLAKPQWVLLRGDEALDNYQVIKIATLTHDGLGHYQQDKTFIPMSVAINATTALADLLRRMIELIAAKARVLQDRRRQFHGDATEFGHSDLTHFLLLQLFNHTLPILQYLYQQPKTHPQQLYQALISFIGSLCAFSQEHDAFNLPMYLHENPTETFTRIDHLLKALLEAVMPSRMAALRLVRETDTLYVVDSIDSSLFQKTSFFVAVLFDAVDTQWLSQFARQVKVGARSMIESIVASALPGAKLTHTQRPPNKLPVKAGYEYFYIEPSGVFWEQIKTERTLSLFTSYDFVKAQIELVTVQE